MLTATLIALAAAVLAAALVLVAVLLRRARAGRPPPTPRPAIGSPAQVWLERGELVAGRLRLLAEERPALAGAADDAGAVLGELRAAATEVAGLAAARARLPVSALQGELQRLDGAIAVARRSGGPAGELQSAREAAAARLGLAKELLAATDSLLARMRAAVAGLERAEDELTGLLATTNAADAGAAGAATAELAERVDGLRAGLAEVRAISARAPEGARGQPGDLPGSVEPPRRT